jgi:hypothetical protein
MTSSPSSEFQKEGDVSALLEVLRLEYTVKELVRLLIRGFKIEYDWR